MTEAAIKFINRENTHMHRCSRLEVNNFIPSVYPILIAFFLEQQDSRYVDITSLSIVAHFQYSLRLKTPRSQPRHPANGTGTSRQTRATSFPSHSANRNPLANRKASHVPGCPLVEIHEPVFPQLRRHGHQPQGRMAGGAPAPASRVSESYALRAGHGSTLLQRQRCVSRDAAPFHQ